MGATTAVTTLQDKAEARFTLAGADTSVREARELVKATLIYWSLRYLVSDAALIVSELVTNACRTTPGQDVRLGLRREERHLFIGVWDASPQRPVMGACELDDESGRGLYLVSMLATGGHGSYAGEDQPGKVVWGRLPI